MAEKNDVFVGNVTFNTTEEQLYEIFSFVGPVKNIRILQDKDTGRPKGFAFVEYIDANTALAAIRRLDGTELNGRKLRVSYSNNSNLKELAKTIGQEVIESEPTLRQETQAVLNLKLHEAWDILELVKLLADEDNGVKARFLFESYPQLVPALLQLQKRLGIISSSSGGASSSGDMSEFESYSSGDNINNSSGGCYDDNNPLQQQQQHHHQQQQNYFHGQSSSSSSQMMDQEISGHHNQYGQQPHHGNTGGGGGGGYYQPQQIDARQQRQQYRQVSSQKGGDINNDQYDRYQQQSQQQQQQNYN